MDKALQCELKEKWGRSCRAYLAIDTSQGAGPEASNLSI